MTTIKNRYRIRQKDGDGNADPEYGTGDSELQALDQVARRAGHRSYVAACALAGLSVAQGLDRITIELVESAHDYITGMIADDMALATLLRYGELGMNSGVVDNYWIFGTAHGERGLEARTGRGPLPRWRRDASAMGDLLERLPMSITRDDEAGRATVRIEAEGNLVYVSANYGDHPSTGHAIRKAMAQAAIDFLSIARESRNA